MLPNTLPLPPGWKLEMSSYDNTVRNPCRVQKLSDDTIVSLMVWEDTPQDGSVFAFSAALHIHSRQQTRVIHPPKEVTESLATASGYLNRRTACEAADRWLEKERELLLQYAAE